MRLSIIRMARCCPVVATGERDPPFGWRCYFADNETVEKREVYPVQPGAAYKLLPAIGNLLMQNWVARN